MSAELLQHAPLATSALLPNTSLVMSAMGSQPAQLTMSVVESQHAPLVMSALECKHAQLVMSSNLS